MDINKLRGKMAENRVSIVELSGELGIVPSTFYRKCTHESFTLGELVKMADRLKLNNDEFNLIFFPCFVAEMRQNKLG